MIRSWDIHVWTAESVRTNWGFVCKYPEILARPSSDKSYENADCSKPLKFDLFLASALFKISLNSSQTSSWVDMAPICMSISKRHVPGLTWGITLCRESEMIDALGRKVESEKTDALSRKPEILVRRHSRQRLYFPCVKWRNYFAKFSLLEPLRKPDTLSLVFRMLSFRSIGPV